MWIEGRMNVTHAKPVKRIRRDFHLASEGMTRFEWPILYPGAVIRIEFSVLPGNSIGNAIRTAKVIFGRVKHDSMVNNLRATIFVREFSKNKFFPEFYFCTSRVLFW